MILKIKNAIQRAKKTQSKNAKNIMIEKHIKLKFAPNIKQSLKLIR